MKATDIQVSSAFDGGNGQMEGEATITSDGAAVINVAITPDPYTDTDERAHFQWFNFRVANLHDVQRLTVNIVNASGASYTGGWENYAACYSFDRVDWRRAQQTSYNNGVLAISTTMPAGLTRPAIPSSTHQRRCLACPS